MAPTPTSGSRIPELAKIVLSQLARLRSEDAISIADFESKVRRLEREELKCRGLTLHWRNHGERQVTFVIETEPGDLCGVVGNTAPREKVRGYR